MKIGLIGLNQTGKTTLFSLLTGKDESVSFSGGKGSASIGTGFVPDERVDFISALYNPKKTTYAKIEFTDVAGFSVSGSGQSSAASKFLSDVRHCDALIHVLRAFESGAVSHDLGSLDPVRDLEAVETEMLFADLEMIEKRIARIKAGKKIAKEHEIEIELLERCYAHLDERGYIPDEKLSEQEITAIRSFSFLTEKPRLAVINLDESQWGSKSWHNRDALQSLCTRLNILLIELCIDMELEISRLPEEDRHAFMEDMGIERPGISALAMAVYAHLGLISFITIGSDEVRAWTIEKGTVAKSAAGKVHTDMERGFIRAEVVKYEDIRELGTMAKVKEKGLFRLEGKEYIVVDGDIIQFRFNV